MKLVKSIVVVGGGTAGWLAALYVERFLGQRAGKQLKITVIESPDLGTVGVGEATVPSFRATLRRLGISEARFLTVTDASLKNGIRFVGWRHGGSATTDCFDHPFETPPRFAGESTIGHWMQLRQHGKTRGSFCAEGIVQSMLMDYSLSPKHADDADFEASVAYGYHLDARKLAQFFQAIALERGVFHLDAHIQQVKAGPGGIERLMLRDGGSIGGDFFIDASGANALLCGQALESSWESFADTLLCDRAVVCPVALPAGEQAIRSYTTSTAQTAGWTWEIDLSTRTGSGYVFSSAHCSDAEAAQLLTGLHTNKQLLAEPRFLNIPRGYRTTPWKANCLAVGFAAGFLEPLESTGIYLIEFALQSFVEQCPTQGDWTPVSDAYNRRMVEHYQHLHEFILLHYVLSARRDSPFWRDCTEGVRIPERLKHLMATWKSRIPNAGDISARPPLFGENSFFYILAGFDYLPESCSFQHAALPVPTSRAALDLVARAQRKASKDHLGMAQYLQKLSTSEKSRQVSI